MTTTTQTAFGFSGMFAVEQFDTVECFTSKKRGVVMAVYEANCDGRVPCLVVNSETGADMMAFVDECMVVRKYIGRYKPHQISDDTAARFRAYAESL